MSYKTTIIDIARELNTTPATVSRALSNHPGISEKTKQTVQFTSSKLNYKRNSDQQTIRVGKSALNLLVDIMEKKEQHIKQKIVLDPLLIVRQSSLRIG